MKGLKSKNGALTARETPMALLGIQYYEAAQEYLRKLPREHFMEATPQATQRKITLESFDVICEDRPDIQVFNELLVQYSRPRKKKPGQVVPDNMVVIHPTPLDPDGSFDLPLQPVGPFWVLEYVSKSNRRKDYGENMRKYEEELKVPYYLLFAPDKQEVALYHHTGGRYEAVPVNANGRRPVQELEIEIALFDGWVRFWFRGEMIPLTGELRRQGREETRRADAEKRRADAEKRRADALEREVARLRSRHGEAKD